MPDPRRTTCRRCGLPAQEVGPISWRGKCRNCALQAVTETHDSLKAHRGGPFDHWRIRTAASVGAIPLDLLDTYLATREHRS